jgi:hypothetical protein
MKGIGKNLAMPPRDPESSSADRDVLTSLPRTRPTRRSAKRDRPADAGARTTPGTGPATTGAGAGTTPPEDAAAAAATDTPARARRRAAAKPKAAAAPAQRAARTSGGSKPAATRAQRSTSAGAKASAASRAASAGGTRRRTTASARSTAASPPGTDAPRETTVPPAGYATEPAGSARRGPDPFALVTTTVQAAGEIAQIGATLWGQAVRSAINRLPRP